jgi:hypothetical protein
MTLCIEEILSDYEAERHQVLFAVPSQLSQWVVEFYSFT